MSGGKCTGRITARDLEILEFIARYGVVPRAAMATWAGTASTATHRHEQRLREHGLINVLPSFGDSGRLLLCTREGLRACGRDELRPARISLASLIHESTVAMLAARLERAGECTLSEREMLARERLEGERVLSAELRGGRYHRADLARVPEAGGEPELVEVELTQKGRERLDLLLRAWRRAVSERRASRVVYRCAPHTRPYVERAVRRTRTAEVIEVQELGIASG